MKTAQENALAIGKILEDSKADDVVVIDVSELNSWTDFFVIATVHSSAHTQGLYKQIKDYVSANEMEIHQTHSKSEHGENWNLIDIGPVVVHLMSQEARDFYELEKLWHNGKKIK
ncbi:MAG: ribosome silencing factor [Treponema sp.]|nr:ribosome silencing factor [Treponema sp.]